jgi:hypothetical protein
MLWSMFYIYRPNRLAVAIILRGGSAWERFGRPRVNQVVSRLS